MTADDDGWETATFEGARAAQRRAAAAATPQQRLAWLEQVLRLAESSGALAAVRRRRQAEVDAAWRDA